jgi:hypothetical protein
LRLEKVADADDEWADGCFIDEFAGVSTFASR